MKHASARMKVYTFSHPQYERIANPRGWRSFIFGLALAERQRAVPHQRPSLLPAHNRQYLYIGTAVLTAQYWSTCIPVLEYWAFSTDAPRKKNSPQTAPRCQCQPKNKTLLLRKTPIRTKKKIKNRPFHRCFSPFGGILPQQLPSRYTHQAKKRQTSFQKTNQNQTLKFKLPIISWNFFLHITNKSITFAQYLYNTHAINEKHIVKIRIIY